MANTEDDSLALRVARLEERLAALEQHFPRHVDAAPVVQSEPSLFDFTRVARGVLFIGGAYLLRALTELHVLPERAGMLLAFVYAMVLLRFEAAVGALIAGGLIWEATTRFHALPAFVACALTVLVAVFMAPRIAAVFTVVTLTGLAIGTGDLLPAAIAACVAGVIAFRLRRDALTTTILSVASDFFAIALIVMTALDRTPHARWMVELALLAIAGGWLGGRASSPPTRAGRDDESGRAGSPPSVSLQGAFAVVIGAGGASLFAFTAPQLAIVWALAAIVAAAVTRRAGIYAAVSIVCAIGSLVAAFIAGPQFVTPMLIAIAFALLPQDIIVVRVTMLCLIVIGLFAAMQTSLALTPLHRSLVLAAAAILFALPRRRESAIVARIILGIAALQILAEDARAGATTMVVALAAYGVAMLIVARRRVTE